MGRANELCEGAPVCVCLCVCLCRRERKRRIRFNRDIKKKPKQIPLYRNSNAKATKARLMRSEFGVQSKDSYIKQKKKQARKADEEVVLSVRPHSVRAERKSGEQREAAKQTGGRQRDGPRKE